jgi:hypothetical protein
MCTIFIGAADLARNKVKTLQNPKYRKMFEEAYQGDYKHYKGELSLKNANKKLKSLLDGRDPSRTRIKKTHTQKKSTYTKEILLMLNPFLLLPEDVDEELIIDNPQELGNIAQIIYAEKLPSLRLWLHYKDYAIGTVPDGVSDSYVYEFKATTQSGRRADQVLEQAIRQVIIYAYAFNRPNIKVQVAKFNLLKGIFPIRVKDLPRPEIITEYRLFSSEKALDILAKFDEDFKTPLPQTRDLRQTLTYEEIGFLKRVYQSSGHPVKRHRERRDAEIKFRANEETLDELVRVLGKIFFTCKKSFDKGRPIVRMYGEKQIEDFIKLLELEIIQKD